MKKGHAVTKQKAAAARPGAARGSGPARSQSGARGTAQTASAAASRAASRGATAQKKTEEKGMASKAAVATKAKVKDEAPLPEKDKEAPETPESPLPLLDLSDAAVKKMIKLAKKRGYVTHDQLNAVLPSEEVSSDQIEDVYAMLNEMGINVVEAEEAEAEAEGEEQAEAGEDEEEAGGEIAESAPRAVIRSETKSEPGERTDDPVRMYLREMGSVELLSREGEIAIAKRIEAGREAIGRASCRERV